MVSYSWAGLIDFDRFIPRYEATDPCCCLAKKVILTLHFLGSLSLKILGLIGFSVLLTARFYSALR